MILRKNGGHAGMTRFSAESSPSGSGGESAASIVRHFGQRKDRIVRAVWPRWESRLLLSKMKIQSCL